MEAYKAYRIYILGLLLVAWVVLKYSSTNNLLGIGMEQSLYFFQVVVSALALKYEIQYKKEEKNRNDALKEKIENSRQPWEK